MNREEVVVGSGQCERRKGCKENQRGGHDMSMLEGGEVVGCRDVGREEEVIYKNYVKNINL